MYDALQDFGEVTQDTIVDVVEWLSYHFYSSGWKDNGGTAARAGQFCGMTLYQSVPDDDNNSAYSVVPVGVTLYQYPSTICSVGDTSYSWRLVDGSPNTALPNISVTQTGVIFYAGYTYPRLYKYSYFEEETEISLPILSYLYFDFNRYPAQYSYQNSELFPPSNSNAYVPASSYYDHKGAMFTNVSTPSSVINTTVYNVPLTPDVTYSYDDYYVIMESALTQINEDTRLNADTPIDIPALLPTDYGDFVVLMESTEPTEETGGCCCNCTVHVDAEGNVTINNNGDTVTNFNVDADATLEANISAAAGAFGAGAIVIDADAEVSLQALAGAFGAGAISVEADGSIVVNVAAGGFAAGAFGAGAIVNPEINVSGEISGSVSIGATDVNLSVSGGDVSFQQSGTVNNYYYYCDPTEETQEPFTIDYDEIMSPSEYLDIMDYTNDWNAPYLETIPTDTFSALPAETLPLEIVGVAAPALDAVTQVISSSGLLPLLAPVSAISFYLHFLQR